MVASNAVSRWERPQAQRREFSTSALVAYCGGGGGDGDGGGGGGDGGGGFSWSTPAPTDTAEDCDADGDENDYNGDEDGDGGNGFLLGIGGGGLFLLFLSLISGKPKSLPKKDKEETQTYAAGTAVWLHSLVAEAQYNGQRALVIPGSSDGRIAVVVAPGEVSAGKKLRVRAKNLVLE